MSTVSKKIKIGIVVSDKMDKTIVVRVDRHMKHPIYGKYIKRSKKFMAHDEDNTCQIGDTVKIEEARPRSKRKAWQLLEIVSRAEKV